MKVPNGFRNKITPIKDEAAQHIPSLFPQFDRQFRIIDTLKETSFKLTFLAEDLNTSTPVIIKMIERKKAPPEFELQLTQEASLMQRVSNKFSNFPIRSGVNSSWFYIVLPFINGESLKNRIAKQAIPWRELLPLSMQLFESLSKAHKEGITHRDIKPENIILDAQSQPAEIHLVDFGSAWIHQFAGIHSPQLVGSARYLSPEQLGIASNSVDVRSDLYSMGIVLHECLSGVPPFDANSVGELMRQHLTIVPPDIRGYQPSAPRSLNEIIKHLIEKDPSKRYQTAKAVLKDLTLLSEYVASQNESTPIIIGLADDRSCLGTPSFIGREKELGLLDQQLSMLQEGNGGVVFIEAKSGEGKTRLLTEFCQMPSVNQVQVFFGQGVDYVARLPFQILNGVAKDLLKEFKQNQSFADRMQKIPVEDQRVLVSLLPSLSECFPATSEETGAPEIFAEQRGLRALCNLFTILGTAEKPSLLVLDDCQWADELTLKLLNYWQQIDSREKKYLLILLSFRSEEVSAAHILRTITPQQHINLRGLNKKNIDALVQTMAGKLPASTLELIFQLSQGSPFMASAVLRGLVETGVLFYEKKQWKQRQTSVVELQSSEHAACVLKRRFDILPEKVIQLLKFGAILGKQFDANFLSLLSETSVQEVKSTLCQAEERHILWTAEENTYVFMHDKLRETLLNLIPSVERKAGHLAIAEHLKNFFPDKLFEIAYHYDASDQFSEAYPYAIQSAQLARARYSLQIAEIQFRIAERGVKDTEREKKRSIFENLGDVLMLRGKYKESAEYFLKALELISNPELKITKYEIANLNRKVGELYFKMGDLVSAEKALEVGLNELGHSIPQSKISFFIRLAIEFTVQMLHTKFPKFFLGKRPIDGEKEALLVVSLHSRLAYTYWFMSGRIACLWTHLRGMNIAEKFHPSIELAQTYSEHAPISTLIGQFRRGIHYVEKSLKIRHELKDLWGQGQSLNFYGVVYYCCSHYRDAIEKCQQAANILSRTGDLWEVNTANWHIAYAYYRLGDLKKAIEISQTTYQAALKIGDVHGIGISLAVWAKASGGRIPSEFIREKIENLDLKDVHTSCELLQAEGIRLLATGNYAEAEKSFQKSIHLSSTSGLVAEYTAPAYSWLVTALRMQIEQMGAHEFEQRKSVLKKANRAARKAHRVSKRFRNNLPHILREMGYLQAFGGNNRLAYNYLAASLEEALKQEAKYEEAKTLLAQALLGASLDWPIDVCQKTLAIQQLKNLNANLLLEDRNLETIDKSGTTISLLDRFDTLLKVGREITTCSSRQDLYQLIYNAFQELLRAESCTVFKVSKLGSETVAAPVFGEARNLSKTLLRETESQKGPVLFLGNQVLQPNESMILSEVESAMCIPISVHGILELVVYLSHHRIQNLFGLDEKRIAIYLSTISGAALENQKSMLALKENADRLIRSNTELERYAHLASHDLQEPLRSLQLSAQVVQAELDQSINDEVQTQLKNIICASARMRTIVADMLRFAQLDSSAGRYENVSLEKLAQNAVGNLKFAIEEKKVELNILGVLPAVVGNRAQLVSVFQNLISNAIKFSSKQPKIRISSELENGYCTVHVQDNGIGFESKYAESIFEPFRRLYPAGTYPGTGIGLAACRKIVQQHQGKIWAESSPGAGTTIHFTLPLTAQT